MAKSLQEKLKALRERVGPEYQPMVDAFIADTQNRIAEHEAQGHASKEAQGGETTPVVGATATAIWDGATWVVDKQGLPPPAANADIGGAAPAPGAEPSGAPEAGNMADDIDQDAVEGVEDDLAAITPDTSVSDLTADNIQDIFQDTLETQLDDALDDALAPVMAMQSVVMDSLNTILERLDIGGRLDAHTASIQDMVSTALGALGKEQQTKEVKANQTLEAMKAAIKALGDTNIQQEETIQTQVGQLAEQAERLKQQEERLQVLEGGAPDSQWLEGAFALQRPSTSSKTVLKQQDRLPNGAVLKEPVSPNELGASSGNDAEWLFGSGKP